MKMIDLSKGTSGRIQQRTIQLSEQLYEPAKKWKPHLEVGLVLSGYLMGRKA